MESRIRTWGMWPLQALSSTLPSDTHPYEMYFTYFFSQKKDKMYRKGRRNKEKKERKSYRWFSILFMNRAREWIIYSFRIYVWDLLYSTFYSVYITLRIHTLIFLNRISVILNILRSKIIVLKWNTKINMCGNSNYQFFPNLLRTT